MQSDGDGLVRVETKRVKPRWIRRSVVVLALALPWIFLLEPSSLLRCGICASWQSKSQYRLGPSRDWSIPLSPVVTDNRLSEAAETLLGPGHIHRWSFSQGTDGYVFIRWGITCALGRTVRENPFVREWLSDLSFRQFVDDELRTGRLTQAEIHAIAELPRWPTKEQVREPKVERMVAQALQLFKDSGVKQTGAGWSDWEDLGAPQSGCPGPPE